MSDEQRVYVVDDEASVLTAVSRLLRSAGLTATTYPSSEEFLARVTIDAAGCLLLDVSMPGLNGLDLQTALLVRGNFMPIVFLTGHADISMSVKAMKKGAVDFLTKPVNDDDLLKAIHRALEKDRVGRHMRAALNETRRHLMTLTPREREVLEKIVAGRLNREVAADLGIVEKTIKVHCARIMEKMHVNSFAELVRLAERAGIGTA